MRRSAPTCAGGTTTGWASALGAERRLRRALALRFTAPAIHQLLGELLIATGRPDEASRFLQIAAEQRGSAANGV